MEHINHPKHYQKEGRKECIVEMLELFGPEAVFIFSILTAYRYDYRAGSKEGQPAERDEGKSRWYNEYAARLAEEHPEVRKTFADMNRKAESGRLNPCPDCGGEVFLNGLVARAPDDDGFVWKYGAECKNCHKRLDGTWGQGKWSYYNVKPSFDEVVKKWNAQEARHED